MTLAPYFSNSQLSIDQLFSRNKEYTAIAGAGVSMDVPSCLLSAKQIVKYLVEYCVAKEEVDKLLRLPGLRYELVIGGIKEFYDKNLNFMNFFDFFEKPNINHSFIAGLLVSGLGDVITTNFDYLIELAAMDQLEEAEYPRILPVITKPDFSLFVKKEQISKIKAEKRLPICKIHGSKKNIVTGENTTQTLVTTMADLGRDREGSSIFSVEPYKLPLLNNLTEARTLIVMGYSGSDDFDIGPTLRDLPNVREIIWINHVMEELKPEIEILEINNKIRKAEISEDLPQIDKVLGLLGKELKEKGSNIKIYRLDVNTTKFVDKVLWNLLLPNIKKPILGGPDKSREELEHIIKGLIGDHVESNMLRWQTAYYLYSNLFLDDDAFRCAKSAIEVAEKEHNVAMKAKALHQAGTALARKVQYEEAVTYFEQALDIADKEYREYLDEIYLSLGNTLKELGQLKDAIKYYRKGGKLAKESNDLESLTNFTVAIGNLYSSQGQYGQAEPNFKEALGYLDKTGDLKIKAAVLSSVASIKVSTLKYNDAIKIYEEILKLYEILGDPAGIATTYHDIATALVCKVEYKKYNEITKPSYDRALSCAQKALEISESLPPSKAASLSTLGFVYTYLEDYENAILNFEKSLKIYQEIKDNRNLASIHNDIAEFWRLRKDYPKSINHHKQCLEYSEKSKNLFSKSKYFDSYGITLSRSGSYSEAREYAIKSLNISEELARADIDVELTKNYYLPRVNVIVQKMNIALSYYKESQWEKAIEAYNKIITERDGKIVDIKEGILYDEDIVDSLVNLSRCYTNLQKYDKAIEILQKAFDIGERTDHPTYRMITRKELAWNFMELKEYEISMEWYQKCIKFGEGQIETLDKRSKSYEADLKNRKKEVATIYNQIGVFYSRQQDELKAIEYYKMAIEKFSPLDAPDNIATITENIGHSFTNRQDYDSAKKYYIEAAQKYGAIGDSRSEMMTYNHIAMACEKLIPTNQESFHESITYYKKAIEIADRLNYTSDKAIYYYNLGGLHRKNKQAKASIPFYQEAINVCETIGDFETLGDSYYYIAWAYGDLNEIESDIEYLKKAIEAYEKLKNTETYEKVKTTIVNSLIDIGSLYSSNNNQDESVKFFRKAIDLARANNNMLQVCKIYNRMGISYFKNKWLEESTQWFKKSFEIAIELQDYEYQTLTLKNIATNFEEEKKWEEAIEWHNKCLQLRDVEKDLAGIETDLFDIGYALWSIKKYPEAIAKFEEQLEVSKKIEISKPKSSKLRGGYRWIGKILSDQNKQEESIQFYLKGVEIDHENGDFEAESEGLGDVAFTYSEIGKIEEAAKYYDMAIEIREQKGFKDYQKYKTRLNDYGMMYFKRSEWQKALDIFEKKKDLLLKYGTPKEKGQAFLDLGNIAQRFNRYEDSNKYYRDALPFAKEINDTEFHYDIIWAMATNYMEIKDWQNVVTISKETFDIADSKGWDSGKYLSMEKMGISYYNLKEPNNALDALDQSIISATTVNKNDAKSYVYIGRICSDAKYYEDALYYFRVALDKENKLGDKKNSEEYSNEISKIEAILKNPSIKDKKIQTFEEKKSQITQLIDLGNTQLVSKDIKDAKQAQRTFGRAYRIANQTLDANLIALSSLNLGKSYAAIRYNRTAYECYKQALDLYDKINDKPSALKAMILYGDAISGTNESDKSFQIYADAQQLAEELGDKSAIINCVNILGNLHVNLKKDYETATKHYRIALGKALEFGFIDQYYQIALNLTSQLTKLQKHTEAIAIFNQAIEVMKTKMLFSNLGILCNNLGLVYMDDLKDYKKALEVFLEGYEAVKNIENILDKKIIFLRNIAILYWNLKEYAKSNETYLQLRDIVEKAGTLKQLGEILNEIGVTYSTINKDDEAFKIYSEALKIAEKINDEPLMARVIENQAILLKNHKDYAESFKYFDRAGDIYEKLDDKQSLENVLSFMGQCLWFQREYENAINYYWAAADNAKKLNNWIRVAADYGSIAGLFREQGNVDKALEFYEESANIYNKQGNYLKAGDMIYEITYMYETLKERQKAANYNKIEYEYRCKDNHGDLKYYSSNRCAFNYWYAKNYKDSAEWFLTAAERARDINKTKELLNCLGYSALGFYRTENYEKAIEINLRILEFESNKDYSSDIWDAMNLLAESYRKTGKLERSIEYNQKAIKFTEESKDLVHNAYNLITKSKILEDQQKYDESIKLRNAAFDILKEFKEYRAKMREYKEYANLYEKIGDPKQAKKYHNLSKIYETKVNEEEEEQYSSAYWRKDEDINKVLTNLGDNFVFLFGSDISRLNPTMLETPKEIVKILLDFFASADDVDIIIENKSLTYKTIISLFKEIYESDLKILEYINRFEKCNLFHIFATKLIQHGHSVITSGNDHLIEHAFSSLTSSHEAEPPKKKGKKKTSRVSKSSPSMPDCYIKINDFINVPVTHKPLLSFEHPNDNYFITSDKKTKFNEATRDKTLIIFGFHPEREFNLLNIVRELPPMKKIFWFPHSLDLPEFRAVYHYHDEKFWKNKTSLYPLFIKLQEYFKCDIYKYYCDSEKLIREKIWNQVLPEVPLPEVSELDVAVPDEDEPETKLNESMGKSNIKADNRFKDFLTTTFPSKDISEHKKLLFTLRLYLELHDIENLRSLSKTAIDSADKTKDVAFKAEVLKILGKGLEADNNFGEALKQYNEAISIYEKTEDWKRRVELETYIGASYIRMENTDLAINRLEDAYLIAEENNLEEMYTEIYMYLGYATFRKGLHFEGLSILTKALNNAEKYKQITLKAKINEYLAETYKEMNNYAIQLGHIQDSIQIYKTLNEVIDLCQNYNELGLCYRNLKNYDAAVESHQNALAIYKNMNLSEEIVATLISIALVYNEKKDFDLAFKTLNEAKQTADLVRDDLLIADVNNNLGLVYLTKEDYINAYSLTKLAFNTYEKYKQETKLDALRSRLMELQKHMKTV